MGEDEGLCVRVRVRVREAELGVRASPCRLELTGRARGRDAHSEC